MEFVVYVLKMVVLVAATLINGRLMCYFMRKRKFQFKPQIVCAILGAVTVLLCLCGGFSLWTVKGIVFALILMYASVQDISTHEADDFLWVMLAILSLVDVHDIASTIFGALAVFLPQMFVAVFLKKGGIGGADIKLSTAAALSLGFYGGVIGHCLGLLFAVTAQLLRYRKNKQKRGEPFALLPYLSAGLMIGYFI